MTGGSSVAVAIACFNQGHYLAEAIDSVLNQTRAADELIVVDDGSRDDTRAVALRNPSVIYHRQENAGLAAARNTGLRLAKSERILFLDADDLLTPNALADGMARMNATLGVAFVYGGFREVTATRELLFETLPTTHADAFAGLLRGNHISMHGTVIYDTKILRANGGFDASLRSCEDFDVYLRLARHYPIAAYSSIAAEYRRHGANMTVNSVVMIKTSRAVLRSQIRAGAITREQSAAAKAGLQFMTDFYGEAAIQEITYLIRARTPMRALRTALGGLCHDPRFWLRLLKRNRLLFANALARRR
jgi:glycosyltransferase involved in cell wall biosynthesis